MKFRIGDKVVIKIKGNKVVGQYLDGDSKDSNIITQSGDELKVSTKELKLSL